MRSTDNRHTTAGQAAIGFPWLTHRSLAQVTRTAALLEAREKRRLPTLDLSELSVLLAKAHRNNPPEEPESQDDGA